MFKIRVLREDVDDTNDDYHEIEHLAEKRFVAKMYQTQIYCSSEPDMPLSQTCGGMVKKLTLTSATTTGVAHGSGGRSYKPRNYGSIYNGGHAISKKITYGKTGRKSTG